MAEKRKDRRDKVKIAHTDDCSDKTTGLLTDHPPSDARKRESAEFFCWYSETTFLSAVCAFV